VAESGSAGERVSVLALCEATVRQLDQVTVATVADLDRDGAFAERGYKSAVQALSDLLGWERFEARRRMTAAEQVTPRTGLGGAVLPARVGGDGGGVRGGADGVAAEDGAWSST
jgi:5-methylcytosine-specific restriction protein A